ncbi:hypothetical protein T439DRAFT_37277 [Meredithblackwellia eburnea MCA 4105]
MTRSFRRLSLTTLVLLALPPAILAQTPSNACTGNPVDGSDVADSCTVQVGQLCKSGFGTFCAGGYASCGTCVTASGVSEAVVCGGVGGAVQGCYNGAVVPFCVGSCSGTSCGSCTFNLVASQGANKRRNAKRQLPSQAAGRKMKKRSNVVDAAKEEMQSTCPSGETACKLKKGGLGYQCINTNDELSSCGGCTTEGEGQNCEDIPFVESVSCSAGKCEIHSCTPPRIPSFTGQGCVFPQTGPHRIHAIHGLNRSRGRLVYQNPARMIKRRL